MSRKKLMSMVGMLLAVGLVVGTFLALIFWQRPGSVPAVVINEVMTSNGSVVQDDDGDFSDWVEIYNPHSTSLSLEGYVLVRNGSESWEFPELVIEPEALVVVWTSGKGPREDGTLHTPFRLSKDGVRLDLFAPGGETLLDSLDVPGLARDRSFGRQAGDASVLCFFAEPTPGVTNSLQCLAADLVK